MTAVRHLTLMLLAGAALAITGSAAQAAPTKAAGECFLSSNVDGFHAHDDRTVYISVGVREIWRLDLMHDCQGLTFKNDIGLEHRGAGPWVCSPIEAEIVYRDSGFPQYCPVSGLHHLTPAERDALPKRDRP
jgi:hypothetical protein